MARQAGSQLTRLYPCWLSTTIVALGAFGLQPLDGPFPSAPEARTQAPLILATTQATRPQFESGLPIPTLRQIAWAVLL